MAEELAPSVSRKTPILVLDDVSSARHVVKRLLSSLGFVNVAEASTFDEGKEMILTGRFPLVIADLHLDDRSASEIIEELRWNPDHCETRFLVITSDANEEEYQAAVRSGLSAFLLKPFSAVHLAEKIEEAMSD